MRYDIKRWNENTETEHGVVEELKGCDRLEVVKQAIMAIDYAQNFEAVVSGPEKEED